MFRDRFEMMSGERSNARKTNYITASRPSPRPRPPREPPPRRRRRRPPPTRPRRRRREPLPPSGHGVSVAPTHALPDLPRASSNPASVHVSPPSSLESTLVAPRVVGVVAKTAARRPPTTARPTLRRATKRQCPSRRSTSNRRPSSPSVTLYRRTRRRARRRRGRPRGSSSRRHNA